MNVTYFLKSSHEKPIQSVQIQYDTNTNRRYILLSPKYKDQITMAVQYPHEFEQAVNFIIPFNLPYLKDPRFRKSLCPSAHNGEVCTKGSACTDAGNLAELYANNIYRNPFYKTRSCKYRKLCNRGTSCTHGHPGDLMRHVKQIADKVFTIGWYIEPNYDTMNKTSIQHWCMLTRDDIKYL